MRCGQFSDAGSDWIPVATEFDVDLFTIDDLTRAFSARVDASATS